MVPTALPVACVQRSFVEPSGVTVERCTCHDTKPVSSQSLKTTLRLGTVFLAPLSLRSAVAKLSAAVKKAVLGLETI